MKPITLKPGDACPNCRGAFTAVYVPTDDEYARAFDRENPIALPVGADTANKQQRDELGALHRCTTCGYQARFPADKGGTQPRGQSGATDARSTAADRGRTDQGATSGGSGGTTSTTTAAGDRSGVDQTDPDFVEWKRQRDEERATFKG